MKANGTLLYISFTVSEFVTNILGRYKKEINKFRLISKKTECLFLGTKKNIKEQPWIT